MTHIIKKKKRIITYEVIEKELNEWQYIGYRLKEIRKSRKVNQLDFAKAIGLSRTSWVNIENGNQALTLKNLKSFCDFFNIKSSEVLTF